MVDICPLCGANLALVGRMHRCVPKDPIREVEEEEFDSPEAALAAAKKAIDEQERLETKAKFDRLAYQREYMRRWRQKRKKDS